MFDGFRSRWTTSAPCACCTAAQTSRNSASRASIVQRVLVAPAMIGAPSTSSITRYGAAVGREPAIEQPRHVRVSRARENLPLAREPLMRVRSRRHARVPASAPLLLVLPVGALHQVHRAHAAVTERRTSAMAEHGADQRVGRLASSAERRATSRSSASACSTRRLPASRRRRRAAASRSSCSTAARKAGRKRCGCRSARAILVRQIQRFREQRSARASRARSAHAGSRRRR